MALAGTSAAAPSAGVSAGSGGSPAAVSGERAGASGSGVLTAAGSSGAAAGGSSGAAGGGGAAAVRPAASGGRGGSAGSASSAGAGGAAGAPTQATQTDAGPAETKPLGYGRATTGGGSAPAMKVATLAALQAAIDAYSGSGGLVLEYTGKFDFDSIPDPCTQHTLPAQKLEIKQKGDISLLGADGSAANFGIHIAGPSSNIIIRNMTLGLLPGGSDSDMISLEGMSSGQPSNIWIDHDELFSSLADCPGAGDTAFDGMIDIKKGADNVTISYNYLHDHHKASLNGYSDDDDMPRHVTFHHNLFENIGSRTPLQRHGYSHLLNNHLSKIVTSGINVRMGGYALIEGNYFQDVLNPVTSRDSSAVGFWDLRANNLAGPSDVAPGNAFGIGWDDGNDGTINATAWKTTAAFPDPLGYDYRADPFACIRDGLRKVAGAGKKLATLTCR
jgi:pectate lyase